MEFTARFHRAHSTASIPKQHQGSFPSFHVPVRHVYSTSTDNTHSFLLQPTAHLAQSSEHQAMERQWWCVCRKYCKGQRTQLKSERTWYRHLQHSAEDERQAIKTAHLSDQFQALFPIQNLPVPAPSSASLHRQREDESETEARPAQRRRVDIDEARHV